MIRPSDALLPLQKLWWAVLGVPLVMALQWLTSWLAAYPLIMAIGPFGVSVILLTAAIRLALVPLAIYQLKAARDGRAAATLVGMLQVPVLLAMYWAIRSFAAASSPALLHFLWLSNLALPDPWFILPLLAAASTYLLARQSTKSRPADVKADPNLAAVQKRTAVALPAIIALSAHFAPAALALYWVTANLAVVAQQHFLAPRLFI